MLYFKSHFCQKRKLKITYFTFSHCKLVLDSVLKGPAVGLTPASAQPETANRARRPRMHFITAMVPSQTGAERKK